MYYHFLDVLVYRKNDGSLGRKVYRTLTHVILYLNSNSHHPAQKTSVLCTLAHRAKALSDLPHLGEEVGLETSFSHNGYSQREITRTLQCAVNIRTSAWEEEEKFKGTAVIPHCSTVSGSIGRLLKRTEKITVLPPPPPGQMLQTVKDDLGLGVLECSRFPLPVWHAT